MKYKIAFIKPNFPSAEELTKDYKEIIRSNWFTNFGPFEQKFSKEAAEYIGSNVHATTISNCTLGLEAAIAVLIKGKGKKIIIPSFTFAAGAEAIIRSGFEPLFIDINEGSLQPNIDQAKLLVKEEGGDIAGVLLCNIFGVGNKEIREWEELCESNNLPLIIDSAAGFGSQYTDDEKIGARGNCEVFSMHATKPFSIGEGGLVTSKDKNIIDKIRSWQNFGFQSDRNIHRIGTNAKMQEINAAIGLRQLRKFDRTLSCRRDTLKRYKDNLKKKGFSFQDNDSVSTVPFVSTITPAGNSAKSIMESLYNDGIEARNYYTPLHFEQKLKKYASAAVSLDVTEKIAMSILSLPVHDDMREDDIDVVCERIVSVL